MPCGSVGPRSRARWRPRRPRKRLPELRVVRELPADRQRVHFGAWVLLEDESGECFCHRIVGSDEFDPERGWISVASPLARALIGHRRDDEVRVATPEGERRLFIAEVSYSGPIDAD